MTGKPAAEYAESLPPREAWIEMAAKTSLSGT